jgi:hypothetical protein
LVRFVGELWGDIHDYRDQYELRSVRMDEGKAMEKNTVMDSAAPLPGTPLRVTPHDALLLHAPPSV